MRNLKITLVLAVTLFNFAYMNAQIWGGKKIKGNGEIKTITRSTSDYNTIKCAGWMDFILVEGNEGNITLEGEENLLEYIITEVNGSVLTVKTKKGVNLKTSWNKTIKITIPFEDIEKVSLSGSGDVVSKNTIRSNAFEVKLAGSGDIILDVISNNLESGISGSGDITLKGKTNQLKTNVTGSGDFHGFDLQAEDVEAKVTGSGDVAIICNGELTARVTGSGDIEYKGNPIREDTKVTGSGSISN